MTQIVVFGAVCSTHFQNALLLFLLYEATQSGDEWQHIEILLRKLQEFTTCWCFNYILYYCKLPKIQPPFCTLLWSKNEEGAFAQILILSRAYSPSAVPHISAWQSQQLPRLSGRTAASINLYYRKSVALCVDTKPRGIKQTCIISGDRGRPRISWHFQCDQQKPLRWPGYRIFCVYVFTNTIDNGANPEFH